MKADRNIDLIRLNDNLAWDLSEEKPKKKGAGRKMWTITMIALSALAVYAKIALWQHNKKVMEEEE